MFIWNYTYRFITNYDELFIRGTKIFNTVLNGNFYFYEMDNGKF